jgi:hypothetical protein
MEESRFFIVSPKDVVVASPYDADDRVQWLIEHWYVIIKKQFGCCNFVQCLNLDSKFLGLCNAMYNLCFSAKNKTLFITVNMKLQWRL